MLDPVVERDPDLDHVPRDAGLLSWPGLRAGLLRGVQAHRAVDLRSPSNSVTCVDARRRRRSRQASPTQDSASLCDGNRGLPVRGGHLGARGVLQPPPPRGRGAGLAAAEGGGLQ